MAKKAAAAPAVNPFAAAANKATAAPAKKPKGTTLALPRELDGEGQLTGESLELNTSVTEVIQASIDERAAKNRLDLHKGKLARWALDRVIAETAKQGVLPNTPITVTNHLGEAVTYVIQDKCQQNALSPEQVQLLQATFGEDGAERMIETRTVYSFNSDVLGEQSAVPGKTVLEIVGEAIMTAEGLTDEQRAALLQAQSKVFMRQNTLTRIAELCSANVERITNWFAAAGSSVVKYIKP